MRMQIGVEGNGNHREYSISSFKITNPPEDKYHGAHVRFDILHHQKRGDVVREIGNLTIWRNDAEQLLGIATTLREIFDALDRYNDIFGHDAPIGLLPEGQEMMLVEQALQENRPFGEMEPIE